MKSTHSSPICVLSFALLAGVTWATDQTNAQITQQISTQGKKPAGLVALDLPKPQPFTTEGGRKGWRLKIPGDRPLATPTVVDGVLYVGGGFGSFEFYALNARTGERVWTFQTGDDGPTAAVVDGGCVAYNTESCILYVHDAKTGRELWHKWLGDPLMSQPAIGNGHVFMVYPAKDGHHRLAGFDLKSGEEIWSQVVDGDLISAPVFAGRDVVAVTVAGTLYRFDSESGKPGWSKELRITSAPRVRGDTIYVSQREERKMEIEVEEAGAKVTRKADVTVEGINTVALDTGKVASDGPRAAVRASFLAPLDRQQGLFDSNCILNRSAQVQYRGRLRGLSGDLDKAGSNEVVARVSKATKEFAESKVAEKAEDGVKDADRALDLANEIKKASSALGEDKKDLRKKLENEAAEVAELAKKAREAGENAVQAGRTMKAQASEVANEMLHDASVGFSSAPAAAKLGQAAANLGKGNVKSVWAYQGSRPCLVGGTCVMVCGDTVRAIKPEDGAVAWEKTIAIKTDATRPITPPALAGGKLYMGTVDGRIICMDPKNGETLWQADVGGRIWFEPAVVDGAVYVAMDDGTILRLETGDPEATGWSMWGGSAGHNGGLPAMETSGTNRTPIRGREPDPPRVPPPTTEYVVKVGDSFSTVARNHGLSIEQLIALNPGIDPRKLKVGQRLKVRGTD
jgi:outer membrane protein assembly factor BamB